MGKIRNNIFRISCLFSLFSAVRKFQTPWAMAYPISQNQTKRTTSPSHSQAKQWPARPQTWALAGAEDETPNEAGRRASPGAGADACFCREAASENGWGGVFQPCHMQQARWPNGIDDYRYWKLMAAWKIISGQYTSFPWDTTTEKEKRGFHIIHHVSNNMPRKW